MVKKKREAKFIFFWIAPALIFLFFLLVAMGWALYASFTNISLVGKEAISPQFIGLKNYVRIFKDPHFFNSIKISFAFTIGSALIGQCLLGLLLAVLLKQKAIKLKTGITTVVCLAWIIPDIVAVYVWGAFTAPEGMLNGLLGAVGLPTREWLAEAPLETLIIANIWKGTAFSMILFSSALETIPSHYYEAADMDGANSWQKFKSITFPLVTPIILMDLLLITIWTFGYFTLVYGLTGGGPGHLTEVFPVFIYKQAFAHYKVGYGAALSIVMTMIVSSVCLFYIMLLRRRSD